MRRNTLIKLGAAALALGIAGIASAQLQLSIAVRETGAGGGAAFTGIGDNGGAVGGIEWVNRDGQTLTLDGTWQQFTFTLATDPILAFAGATANGVLDGTYGVLEHIRIKSTGAFNSPVTMWIDDVANTITPPGGAPTTTTFGSFEGYADGTEVIFQEPSFSGSTSANVMAGSTSGVDNTMAHSGLASDRIAFQFVDSDVSRWVRLTTFNTGQLPNPQIRFDQQSQISFWVKAVPEPASMTALTLGALALIGRRRRK